MAITPKVLAIMAGIPGLHKDKQNKEQGFDFLSEEKVTTYLHDQFAKHGLTIRPVAMDVLHSWEYTTRSGSVGRGLLIRATYELADDEETRVIQTLGSGMDVSDKAAYKAMTGAYKYALRESLMISTGDDPDAESPEEHSAAGSKPAGDSPARARTPSSKPPSSAQLGYLKGLLDQQFPEVTAKDGAVIPGHRTKQALEWAQTFLEMEFAKFTELTSTQVSKLIEYLASLPQKESFEDTDEVDVFAGDPR